MIVRKKIILILCFFNLSLFANNTPPELVRIFFKRFTQQMGSSPKWSFTTPSIKTEWGTCLMGNDEIIVTIGEENVHWSVPGGPWTICYITEADEVLILPIQSIPDYRKEALSISSSPKLTRPNVLEKKENLLLRSLPLNSMVIEEDIASIVCKNIGLTTSIEYIIEAIKQAKERYPSLEVIKILDLLEKKIEKLLWYNLQRKNNRCNYSELFLSGCFFAGATGLGYLFWRGCSTGHELYDQQFQEKVASLNAVGITVTEERYGNLNEIIIHRPFFVSEETRLLIKTTAPQLISIRDEEYNEHESFSIKNCCLLIELLGMFTFLRTSWEFLKLSLYPKYQENAAYYEELLKALKESRQNSFFFIS